MTGFASTEGGPDGLAYQFDARSVNGRSLEVRTRLPAGWERFEVELRRLVAQRFKRGTISLTLTARRPDSASVRYEVNRDQLRAYLDAIHELAASGAVAAPRADGLLALKGVIDTPTEDVAVPSEPAVLAAARELLDRLRADRASEGSRIAPLVVRQLDEMERLRASIDAHPERTLAAVKARLDGQLAALLDGPCAFEPERLHHEAALLATRADVREELDRLTAHVAAARDLIAEGGPIGRKLDFLAQELNREVNTICAKAPHHGVTALGLELKAVVEQMREQVQNLE